MPQTILLSSLTDNVEPEIEIRELALANGACCSDSAIETFAVGAPMVVLMNDGERQISCGYTLLTDLCVDERRLLGGGTSGVDDELMDDHERMNGCPPSKTPCEKPHIITCAS